MNDEKVDALLAALDSALSVEPSPSVVAKVRTGLDSSRVHAFAMPWRLVVAAGLVIAFAGYLAWPRLSDSTSLSTAIVSNPAPESVRHPAVRVPAPPATVQTTPPRASSAPVTSVVTPDQRVLISPRERIALEQLKAAVDEGLVDSESFAKPSNIQAPLILTPVAIETIRIDSVPVVASREGGTSDRD